MPPGLASHDDEARIWDVRTGASLHRLRKHFGPVADARFSPNGRWIVTAGPKRVGLWSSAGDFVRYLRGPTSTVTAAAFTADSRTVLTEERNSTVRAYRCLLCGTIPELVALAQKRLAGTGRTLTSDERRRYGV
jgi:WD40 repeat protein